jgi:aliphatic sulfonates family ABC transporter substrate-binding protein
MSVSRRAFAALAFASLVIAPTLPVHAADTTSRDLRIGYQKVGALLLLKERGTLEKKLAPLGVHVSWVQFPSGPPLLEALNAGAIDFGYTGDAPPVFAQAAGVKLVYVASIPSPGKSSAILVHKSSSIASIADLRGKKIALVKGSSAHAVLVRVLAKGGVSYGDITPVFLQPADAAAAFKAGSVDAWAIWDPFYAVAQQDPDARVLTDAVGIAPSNDFFLASQSYAAQNADVLKAIVDEAVDSWHWASTHQSDLAQLLSDASGVSLDAEKVAAARWSFKVTYITPAVIAEQQTIADTFAHLGLIPTTINVASIVWTPSHAVAEKTH